MSTFSILAKVGPTVRSPIGPKSGQPCLAAY